MKLSTYLLHLTHNKGRHKPEKWKGLGGNKIKVVVCLVIIELYIGPKLLVVGTHPNSL